MILILIFAEVLGLYGLIVGIILHIRVSTDDVLMLYLLHSVVDGGPGPGPDPAKIKQFAGGKPG
jgi:hypothetical protein